MIHFRLPSQAQEFQSSLYDPSTGRVINKGGIPKIEVIEWIEEHDGNLFILINEWFLFNFWMKLPQ